MATRKKQFLSGSDLKNFPLFEGVSADTLDHVATVAELREVKAGEFIIHEGEEGREIFLVLQGELEIISGGTKREPTSHYHRLRVLKSGHSIGEMALIDSQPRSASVRATCPSTLLVLSLTNLKQLKTKFSDAYDTLLQNVGKELNLRLRHTNEITISSLKEALRHSKMRETQGRFFVNIVVILCIYTYLLVFLTNHHIIRRNQDFYVYLLIALDIIPIYLVMKKMDNPLSYYGVTLAGWRPAVYESLLYTLPVLALLVALKWFAIHLNPAWQHIALFNPNFTAPHSANFYQFYFYPLLLYTLSVPAQEFIARGILQGSLQFFLEDRYATLKAILFSNLMFSSMHVYLSVTYAITALILGLFWGWLYSRHKTLIGASLSHMLIGIWGIYVLGVQGLLTLSK